ncbi:MAG: hypothetical protein AAF387_22710 [Pseudomonadota bacterium]
MIVEIVSVAIAVIAALASAFFSVRALRAQAFQNRLQYAALKDQFFSDFRRWASDSTDQLSLAVHLCELDPNKCEPPSLFERRLMLRTRLSTLIDRGRFFMPNRTPEIDYQDQEDAYRGYRHELLDSLVAAYDLATILDYKNEETNRDLREQFVAVKREFVTQAQEILDPRARDREFEQLMEQ